jgi:cytochrome P450
MSCSQSVQEKLRAEVRMLPTDTPADAELSSLVYLDHVVRETLRVYSPVHSTERVATQDDAIPLREPYTDVHGVVRREIQ